jgi:hypothetical protein
MLAKELYKVGATRVGLQKINPKERQLQLNVHDPSPRTYSPTILSKSVKKEVSKQRKKITFLLSLQNQNTLLHAFACFFAVTTMVKVVVVVVGGVGGAGGAVLVLISLSTTMEY